jgi:hypothetical protein
VSSPSYYLISNDPACDSLYARIFTEPGILVVREFPITESRMRVFRQSYTYDEIVEELRYCLRSHESAERIARWIIDDILLPGSHLDYPELIRTVVDASIATVVHDPAIRQRLSWMFPLARIIYLRDENYDPITRAFETLKATWTSPGADFPWHLRPLRTRALEQCGRRFPDGLPNVAQTVFSLK